MIMIYNIIIVCDDYHDNAFEHRASSYIAFFSIMLSLVIGLLIYEVRVVFTFTVDNHLEGVKCSSVWQERGNWWGECEVIGKYS